MVRDTLLDRPGTLPTDGRASRDGPAGGPSRLRLSLPVGAVLLALLQVVHAAWLAAALGGVTFAADAGMPAQLLTFGAAGQYAIMAAVVLRFGAAIGLLTGASAAWILAMLVTGSGLAVTLAGYAIGRPDDIRLLLDVASAFYLNQPGVRAVFGIHEGRPR